MEQIKTAQIRGQEVLMNLALLLFNKVTNQKRNRPVQLNEKQGS